MTELLVRVALRRDGMTIPRCDGVTVRGSVGPHYPELEGAGGASASIPEHNTAAVYIATTTITISSMPTSRRNPTRVSAYDQVTMAITASVDAVAGKQDESTLPDRTGQRRCPPLPAKRNGARSCLATT